MKEGTSVEAHLKHMKEITDKLASIASLITEKDQVVMARRMSKLGPTLEKDKATVQQAMSELKEDMDMIAERQKHIQIADQSEHGGHVQGKQCGG